MANHDRSTEAGLVKVEYGSIADMLARHGFRLDNSVVAAPARGDR